MVRIGVMNSLRERNGPWLATAIAVAVVLTSGAWLGASALSHKNADKSRRDVQGRSARVASSLQLALQHEEDLIVSLGGFVIANPNQSSKSFRSAADSIRALQRYPELVSLGYIEFVRHSQVRRFVKTQAQPAGPSARGFQIVPPGGRPFYCLPAGGLQRGPQITTPAGSDLCAAEPTRSALLTARDTGRGTSEPYTAGGIQTLGVLEPVFRQGLDTSTIAGRRSALLGWVGMTVIPTVVLAKALSGYADTAVRLNYRQAGTTAVFSAGLPSKHAQSVTIALRNGWSVTTFASAVPSGLPLSGAPLALLGPGLALSGLLGFLVWMLGTGRARAVRSVRERTRELREVVSELEETQTELVSIDVERQRLLARTVQVGEAERMALAANLHDGPIQHLTAVGLQLDLLILKINRGAVEDQSPLVAQLRESVAEEMISLRRLMTELRPPIIDQRGIEVALRDCVDTLLDGDSLRFQLECDVGDLHLPPEMETAIYRVAREAVTNIRRHSEATNASLTLTACETAVVLVITDDGNGFDPATVEADHFGLVTMREGIEAVSGTWRVETKPGHGTRIEATLPWKQRLEREQTHDAPARVAA